jgi:phenylacetate-coenzyme A ligase PaaK-like adenylate-forming protein
MLLLLCVIENIPFYHNQIREARKPFVLGDIYNLPKTAVKAAFAGIDGIETSPTIALNFAEHLKKHYDMGRIKSVGITGEILSANLKARLQEEYPNATFFNAYGLIETGFLGWQCKRLSISHVSIFHTHPGAIFYEIIDPQTRKAVKFGEAGELVVTDIKRMATPLIRYRTGDLARFLKNECPCGAEGDLIEIMGRAEYDFVRLGQGIELDWRRVDDTLFALRDLIKDVQIRVRDEIKNGRLVLVISVYLVPANHITRSEKEIWDSFMDKMICETRRFSSWNIFTISLKKAAEMGLAEIEVKFVDSIEKIGHKSRLLVDERAKHDH